MGYGVTTRQLSTLAMPGANVATALAAFASFVEWTWP
jgi:hypothetical protein